MKGPSWSVVAPFVGCVTIEFVLLFASLYNIGESGCITFP
jgi:hypothetical protein